jgi:hypothetical protein
MGTIMVGVWATVFTLLTMRYFNVPFSSVELMGPFFIAYAVIIDIFFGKKSKEESES